MLGHSCNLCGSIAGGFPDDDEFDDQTQWFHAIRAIYVLGPNWLSPYLSGLGCMPHSAAHLSVPRSAQESAFSPNYNFSAHRKEIQISSTNARVQTTDPHLATGFVFHESCFRLLQYAIWPEPIHVDILNLFLRSFGVSESGEVVVNWGHTYGGLYFSTDAQTRTIHMKKTPGHPPGTSLHDKDPLLREDFVRCLTGYSLRQLLEKREEKEKEHARTTIDIGVETNDAFKTLPLELLEMILASLPSKDVQNARIASRILGAVPLRQAFWRSRFAPGGDFEYVPEPLLFKKGFIKDIRFSDPRIVYNAAMDQCSSLSLANRSRVWKVIQPLSDALISFSGFKEIFGGVEPAGSPIASLWQPHLQDEDISRWDCAFGELLDSEMQPFYFGCRPLFKRTVELSAGLAAVRISVLRFHDTTYVTGLRFCFADGGIKPIGYVLEDREVYVPIEGYLSGFEVAYAERGIHALSIITEHGTSTMAGDKGELRMKRLEPGIEVTAVKAYFDVSTPLRCFNCINLTWT